MASADLKEELNCSICLEVYKDPVTLRCGHNFCQACINRVLDSQKGQGVYTCPECRAVFKKRPWLQKNVTLSNIAERFHSTLPDQKKTGITCTYCIHSAIKCCQHCEVSLCDSHLKAHSKSPEHVLVEPTTSPGKWKCSIHNMILQYYCTVDSTCICKSCLQDAKHCHHQVLALDEASKNKKDKLKKTLKQLTSSTKEIEKSLQGLQEKRKKANDAETAFTAHVRGLFQQIRQRLDVLEVQAIDQITKQAEMNAKPVSDLIRQLEIKKDELCSKICHIEELINVTDPLTVLLEKESTRANFCITEKGGSQDVPKIAETDEMLISLILQKQLSEIWMSASKVLNIPGLSEIRLDMETAASNVAISPDLLIAQGTQDNLFINDTYNRFESYQVLSRLGLGGGRHYWEVELCDTNNNWRIGMSYYTIARAGGESVFGNTSESWCLCKCPKGYSFRHDGNRVYISTTFNRFKRLGIYLNFDLGRLSFYNLEPEIRHLHTFYNNFMLPLHAAIRVSYGEWVKIIAPVLIRP